MKRKTLQVLTANCYLLTSILIFITVTKIESKTLRILQFMAGALYFVLSTLSWIKVVNNK